MTESNSNSISFSMENETDFIKSDNLIDNDWYHMSNIRKLMNKVKTDLIINVKLDDDNFYKDILKITNRFDKIIDKIAKL